MNILFCDQALLRFGYSIYQADTLHCSLHTVGLLLLDGKTDYFERLMKIENWLVEVIDEHNIEVVVIEDIQFQRNVQTYRKLCILFYVLESTCRKLGIRFEKLHVNVWRSYGVKKLFDLPDGSKKTLYNYLYRGLGHIERFDDNMSDSVGMGYYWCNKNLPKASIEWEIKKGKRSEFSS